MKPIESDPLICFNCIFVVIAHIIGVHIIFLGCSKKTKNPAASAQQPPASSAPVESKPPNAPETKPAVVDNEKKDVTLSKAPTEPLSKVKATGINEDPGGYENCDVLSSEKLRKIAMDAP